MEEEFDLEFDCGQSKICRNVQHIHYGFDAKSWKEKLKEEGKWNE